MDLTVLLLEDKQEIELRICKKADKPSFKMVPSHKKDITFISQWHKAIRKFPDKQEGILIYMDIISELAVDDEDCITYNKRFRKNHASGRESFRKTIHIYLAKTTFWRRTPQEPDTYKDAREKDRQIKKKHPRGYCFTFHNGNQCRGCDFKHECYRCVQVPKIQREKGNTNTRTLIKVAPSEPTLLNMTASRPNTSSLDSLIDSFLNPWTHNTKN